MDFDPWGPPEALDDGNLHYLMSPTHWDRSQTLEKDLDRKNGVAGMAKPWNQNENGFQTIQPLLYTARVANTCLGCSRKPQKK